jgi:hypothetical protein
VPKLCPTPAHSGALRHTPAHEAVGTQSCCFGSFFREALSGLGRARLGQSSGVEIGALPRIQGHVSPGSHDQGVPVSDVPLLGLGARRELTPFPARPRVLSMRRIP